ncbi:aldose 1-epimerase family protein [Flavobacterium frigoris]|uniref:LacX protein n=1 Tax=Flavobacterium frigoris (strain PS1) TaxID=1086011 RepID=H7FS04_FLAFP|nr:aldose 1-epimerase family protein [Flavobacterium frigoris]EIA08432.1 LacX protein [Flavobacterium frigoris PS1]
MTTIITNSHLTAEINHSGAELFSLKSNSNNKEYIWQGNPEFWGKHSPILFPIVGTLKDNSYTSNSIQYHLSRHGFARDTAFELINKNQNSATFSMQSNEETLQVYPFHFELQISYILENKNLNINYKVINKAESKMPFSIGAHPAFSLSRNFDNYSIQFEKEEPLVYNLLENDLISNETKILATTNSAVPLDYKLFENDALIFKSLQSNYLTILETGNPLLRVRYNNFPHLGIWTKKDAPFLCVEPWFGYSDSVESSGNLMEKEGIQILDSYKIFESKFSIEII